MQWICNFSLFFLFSGILLEVIADTKYYKFAKWVTGVILLLQFLQPLSGSEMLGEKFRSVFDSFDYALGSDRIVEKIYQVNEQTEDSVLKAYKESISLQIDRMLQKNGLRLKQAELLVEQDGTLTELRIEAQYLDGTESKRILVPTIMPIEMKDKLKRKTVSPMEIYIRELLAECYQMEQNKIEVVIREAE